MQILEILLIAVALSMDAFAVAICKGLSTKQLRAKHYLIIGAWFGGFQALMPTAGFFLGRTFADRIAAVDHWIAFALLVLIGANMVRESLSKKEEEVSASFAFLAMLSLAVATSIDALAAPLIGCTTFGLSALGLKVGNVFGLKYKARAELAGGIILVLMGVKMLLSGLGILPFEVKRHCTFRKSKSPSGMPDGDVFFCLFGMCS